MHPYGQLSSVVYRLPVIKVRSTNIVVAINPVKRGQPATSPILFTYKQIILKKDRTPLLPIVFTKVANRYLWKKGRSIPVDREYPPARMRVPLIQTRK